MNTEKFLKNITDQVKELQIKLGYAREVVRLYYPAASLNVLLGLEGRTAGELAALMNREPSLTEGRLGRLEFSVHKERVEVHVPPEGVQYVHDCVETPSFLKDMIEFFQNHHHGTLEEICGIFASYSENYHCDRMPEGADFDYVIYFEDSSIDEYYYCIKEEMDHTIYHRFTKEDYLAFS